MIYSFKHFFNMLGASSGHILGVQKKFSKKCWGWLGYHLASSEVPKKGSRNLKHIFLTATTIFSGCFSRLERTLQNIHSSSLEPFDASFHFFTFFIIFSLFCLQFLWHLSFFVRVLLWFIEANIKSNQSSKSKLSIRLW